MRVIGISLLSLLILLMSMACGGGGGGSSKLSDTLAPPSEPALSPETQSAELAGKVSLLIDLASFSSTSRSKALGQFSDVDKVFARVTDADGNPLLSEIELVHVNGTLYEATLTGLPVDVDLNLSVEARNASGVTIFSGSSTFQASSGAPQTVSVVTKAVDDGGALNNPPRISKIVYSPKVIAPGDKVSLRAEVSDADGDELIVAWSATEGEVTNADRVDGA